MGPEMEQEVYKKKKKKKFEMKLKEDHIQFLGQKSHSLRIQWRIRQWLHGKFTQGSKH